ncbi:Relaxase/Mobilisation nuclease domain-containing protein [Modicisalibacter ilicicola DSM 19980]|uniref:Relaxase/Mobilisation nuclease domain-containing protein n=1 Tax=Modicisalibacter ilicicola DSM 19980 TaxID=1121942 RepID=A0A1M4U672_9GAMM|nr:relaxase/mobilization nuclease domain-containing protein [Halomonas ilicicola]SHE52185.1 Relaxase/Mobilisation nuclease domain-containing protein [Halomonas ilicicola DSM 19980]
MISSTNQVIVRVDGHAYNAHQIQQDLMDISKNGTVELEDERGFITLGEDEVCDLARDWSQDRGKRRKNTRDTTNIIMSIQAIIDPSDVKNTVREFAKQQFGQNHQYAMALHTDTDSPQVHLTVKSLGYDGHRLHVKKGDPKKWRESLAAELGRLGIKAKATLRVHRRGEDG